MVGVGGSAEKVNLFSEEEALWEYSVLTDLGFQGVGQSLGSALPAPVVVGQVTLLGVVCWQHLLCLWIAGRAGRTQGGGLGCGHTVPSGSSHQVYLTL